MCTIHTVQLGQASFSLSPRGIRILVLGPGKPERARWLARLIRAPYPVLADPGRGVFRSYGLGWRFFRIQQSGTFLVDREGALAYAHRATNPLGALRMPELLEAIARLPGPRVGG